MKVADLMTEAVSLPLEDRVLFVDSFLQTLNPADNAWKVARLAVARRRLDDFDSGRVSGIPGEAVFERTRQRPGQCACGFIPRRKEFLVAMDWCEARSAGLGETLRQRSMLRSGLPGRCGSHGRASA